MLEPMHEILPAQSTNSDTRAALTQRIQTWLAQRGVRALILISIAVILLTLGDIITSHFPGAADWRVYATILILVVLLALRIGWENVLLRIVNETYINQVVIFSSSVLVLLALWLNHNNTMLIGYLFPVLAAEAAVTLRVRTTGLLISGLLAGWLLRQVQDGVSMAQLTDETFALTLGVAITAAFASAVRFYLEQAERMQQLNAELLASQARERELAVAAERVRLARDIHDGLGHHLTVLAVQLQAAERLLERDPSRVAATLALCRAETQTALADVRQSVAALRQSPLDGRSLAAALDKLTHDFSQAAGMQACLIQQGSAVPLSSSAGLTIYRTAQEGLTNAQKHALNATQVTITLAYTAMQVRLTVQDNGAPVPPPTHPHGFGLAGLRERADQLGGTLQAGPLSPQGFRLELQLPLSTPSTTGATT